MALGSNHSTSTTHDVFIPEIWKDEIIVSAERNLVAGKLFWRINHNGKKGDVLHLPNVSDLTASAKSASTQVTISTNTEAKDSISLDKHYEVSVMYEDFLMAQQSYDLRSAYTSKAGYALAKQIDTDILTRARTLQGGTDSADYDTAVIGSDGVTAYVDGTPNGTPLADAGIRKMIQTLDEADVPEDGRFLIIPPSQKNVMLNIDKFTLYHEIGKPDVIQKGRFGTIYGLEVYMTNNLPQTTASKETAFMGHKESIACAMQMDIRVQASYIQEYLGTLVTSDCIYGVNEIRDDFGIVAVVEA